MKTSIPGWPQTAAAIMQSKRRAPAWLLIAAVLLCPGDLVLAAQQTQPDDPFSVPAAGERPPANQDDQPADPTVPSEQIQQGLPVEEQVAGAAARPIGIQLPRLPDLQLRGLIFQSDAQGTALIAAGEKTTLVRLNRARRQGPGIPTPPRQFAAYQEALRQLDDLAGQAASPEGADPQPTLDWLDGFEVEGILFTVEAFSKDAVLLRAHPHNQYVLLR